jgi:hypothetical protein
MLRTVMAVDPNLDLTRLTSSDSLQINDSKGDNYTALEECAGTVAGKFRERSVRCGRGLCADDFATARIRYCGRSLGARNVLTKRSISFGIVHIARDVSRLRNVLVKGFVQLRKDSHNATGDYFHGLEEELHTTFTPTFMSRGESAHELDRIREFLDTLLPNIFNRRNARQIRSQCDHVLECGGAMALFGVLRSALRAVR